MCVVAWTRGDSVRCAVPLSLPAWTCPAPRGLSVGIPCRSSPVPDPQGVTTSTDVPCDHGSLTLPQPFVQTVLGQAAALHTMETSIIPTHGLPRRLHMNMHFSCYPLLKPRISLSISSQPSC